MVLQAIILQKEYGCSYQDEWFDGVANERMEMFTQFFKEGKKGWKDDGGVVKHLLYALL